MSEPILADLVVKTKLFGPPMPGCKLPLDTLARDLRERAKLRDKMKAKNPEHFDPTDTSDAALGLLLARIDSCKQYAMDYDRTADQDPYKLGAFNSAVTLLNILNGSDFREKTRSPFPEQGFTRFSPTAIKCDPEHDTGLRYKHNEIDLEVQLLSVSVVNVDSPDKGVLIRNLQTGSLEVLPMALFEELYTCTKPESPEPKSEETNEKEGDS